MIVRPPYLWRFWSQGDFSRQVTKEQSGLGSFLLQNPLDVFNLVGQPFLGRRLEDVPLAPLQAIQLRLEGFGPPLGSSAVAIESVALA